MVRALLFGRALSGAAHPIGLLSGADAETGPKTVKGRKALP
jgi:hypothetical protein